MFTYRLTDSRENFVSASENAGAMPKETQSMSSCYALCIQWVKGRPSSGGLPLEQASGGAYHAGVVDFSHRLERPRFVGYCGKSGNP
jgi:hypothetical protein